MEKILRAFGVLASLTWGFVLVGVLCCWTAVALADPIPTLFNTGVDNNSMVLPDAAKDPHYQLIQSADPIDTGPDAFVVYSNFFPIPPWLANGPDSNWIAPDADQRGGRCGRRLPVRNHV